MLPFLEATPPLYSKIVYIFGKNESQKERKIKTEHLLCRSIFMRGGDSRGAGEGTNVDETKTSGGGEMPVRHKIPLRILIFLVCCIFVAPLRNSSVSLNTININSAFQITFE